MSFIAFILGLTWEMIEKQKIFLLFRGLQGKSLAATRHQKRFSRLKIHGHPSLNNSKIITSFVHCVYHITRSLYLYRCSPSISFYFAFTVVGRSRVGFELVALLFYSIHSSEMSHQVVIKCECVTDKIRISRSISCPVSFDMILWNGAFHFVLFVSRQQWELSVIRVTTPNVRISIQFFLFVLWTETKKLDDKSKISIKYEYNGEQSIMSWSMNGNE